MGVQLTTNIDDKIWIGRIPAISIDFEEDEWADDGVVKDKASCLKSTVTRFKSQAQAETMALGRTKFCKTQLLLEKIGDSVDNTNRIFQLEYVLCVWQDLNLNKRTNLN